MSSAFRRFAAGVTGSLVAAVLAASADAVRASGGFPARTLFFAELGLIVPFALALGVAAGLLRAVLLSPDWPSPRRALEAVRRADDEARFGWSLAGAVAVLGALAALVLVGRV